MTTATDSIDTTLGDGKCINFESKCSLRAAVMEANSRGIPMSIIVPSGTYPLNISGADEDSAATGDLDLKAQVTITGTVNSTFITAGTGFGDRIFDIPAGVSASVTLNGLTLQNGTAPGSENGGAIQDLGRAPLSLVSTSMTNNSAPGGSGGGLYAAGAAGSTVTLNMGTDSNNSAGVSGGAIDIEGSTLVPTMTQLTISNNTAGNGGGVSAFVDRAATGSITSMSFLTVTGNVAASSGGGLYASRAFMSKLTVTGNRAPYGGGMTLQGSTIPSTITGRSNLNTNTATVSGGGLYTTACGTSCGLIQDATMDANTATVNGSGISLNDGLAMKNVTVSNNQVVGSGDGGAIYHAGAAGNPLVMTNVTVAYNSGGSTSGGLVVASGATDVISNVSVAYNTGGAPNGIARVGAGAAPQVWNDVIQSTGTNCSLPLASLGHNIESGTSCGMNQLGDISGVDPMLVPALQDNGGPTLTLRLKTGSPAIDTGDNAGCAPTDGRVVTRPQDGDANSTVVCDMGAYEVGPTFVNAELGITSATASPSVASPDTDVTFVMTLLNLGPFATWKSVLRDDLPSTLTYVSCSATLGGICGGSGNNRTVTWDPIANGGTPSATIVAHVVSNAPAFSRIDNFVSVSSDSPDTMSYNNMATPGSQVSGTPSISIKDASVIEGNTGTTTANFAVTLSTPRASTVTVNYSTANQTAIAGTDYVAIPSTALTFAPGETSKTVPVTVNGDTASEGNETFLLKLASPSGATLADVQAVGTIIDDEGAISMYVSDTRITEGNSGTTSAVFTISLSAPPVSDQTVSINYSTVDGTAKAPTDYVAIPSTPLTIAAGQTSATVDVTVNGDTLTEPNETFTLKLATPSGVTLADTQATGTIVTDDGTPAVVKPSLYVSDAFVMEPDSGTVAATFTVTLAPASTSTVTVNYSTANVTATGGTDYVAITTTPLSFSPGQTSKTVTVTVNGDTAHEGNETFLFKLGSPSGATLADTQGTGTIIDNESVIGFYVSEAGLLEGNSGTTVLAFTVWLSDAPVTGQSVTVQYATVDGTATAGSDYVAVALNTLTFLSGQTSATVNVTVNGDTLVESNENFMLSLSVPKGGALADSQGSCTVANDD